MREKPHKPRKSTVGRVLGYIIVGKMGSRRFSFWLGFSDSTREGAVPYDPPEHPQHRWYNRGLRTARRMYGDEG